MTTKIKVTMEEYAGMPVTVCVKTPDRDLQIVDTLLEKGDSATVYVHQNQDVVVGEIKTTAA
ncbi:MAG TPA: hypothetical protein VN679_15260 [Candidatus Acidoferrales bacterium]|jgi:transcriptional regulator|nr:hypothetical protein [Candidatus Acidoferrales bacterium]